MTNEKDLEAFEEYIDKITNNRKILVNRLDLHKQTFLAGIAHARREDKEKIEKLENVIKNEERIRQYYVERCMKLEKAIIFAYEQSYDICWYETEHLDVIKEIKNKTATR